MGTEVAETLGLAPVEMGVDCGNRSCSGSVIPPLVVAAEENGLRVSAEGEEEEEGKICDVSSSSKVEISVETKVSEAEIVADKGDSLLVEETNNIVQVTAKTGVVETEISTEKLVGEGDGLLVEEGSNTFREISDPKHEKNEVGNRGVFEEVKHLVNGDSTVLTGDGSDGKGELEQETISLVAEFHGPPGIVEDSGKDCDKGSVVEAGEDKVTGNQGSMDDTGDVTGEGGIPPKDNQDGKEGKDLMKGDSGENTQKGYHNGEGQDLRKDDGSEDDENDEKHDYRVGDFVWGKIRSHPWWPGRIYDPSDASEYAKRHSKPKGLLVAYFGDGSFSWCYPSQLKPFADGFEQTSKQSNSKNFVNAVKKALDEALFVAELKMVCSCVPDKHQNGLAKSFVLNAGIKPGVLVPGCDLDRLTGHEYGPSHLIAALKYVAVAIRPTNMLEFAVLKGWLSAYFRAKRGCELAVYREPMSIEGLEDKNRDVASNLTNITSPVEIPVQGPSEEDWLSSPLYHGSSKSVLQRCMVSDDKLYQRRKKSVADLMNKEVAVDPKAKKGKVGATKDLTGSGRLVYVSGKRKLKTIEDVVQSQDDNSPISPSSRKRGRKKAETLETSKSRENSALSNEKGGNELSSPSGKKRERKNVKILETPKCEENEVPSTDDESEKETNRGKGENSEDDKEDMKEESKAASGPRERKKSKYLSPPFTNAISSPRKTSSKKHDEAVSEKIRKSARMGERMTKVAGKLIGSTPIKMSGGDETHEDQLGTPVESVRNKSVQEVVGGVRDVACNPSSGLDRLDGKFIHAFRSLVYKSPEDEAGETGKFSSSNSELSEADSEDITRNGKNEENKSQRSKKLELVEKDVNQTEPELVEPETPKASNDINEVAKSRRKRTSRAGEVSTGEKNREVEPGRKRRKSSNSKDLNQTEHESDKKTEDAKSGKKREKQANKASKTKKSSEDLSEEGSAPPSLIVSFPPAFALPTKEDVIGIFRKYGRLNEKETNVLYNSFCARIVFLKATDAEEAYKTSAEEKHFGTAEVHYRLQYPPTNQKTRAPKTAVTPVKPPPAAAEEVSPLVVLVKEKLELMTSMVAKSEMSPELKSNLEGEMGGLLEKVNAAIGSSSC